MASSSDDSDRLSRLYTAIDEIGPSPITVTAFRHTAPNRDPLSGAGARLFGARWNRQGGAAAVYLAEPLEACLAEFFRMAEGQGRGAESFLPRTLHTIELSAVELVDLRSPEALAALGLDSTDVRSDDRTKCQEVGAAIELLGYKGLYAESATHLGRVIALFETRIDPRQVRVIESRTIADFLHE